MSFFSSLGQKIKALSTKQKAIGAAVVATPVLAFGAYALFSSGLPDHLTETPGEQANIIISVNRGNIDDSPASPERYASLAKSLLEGSMGNMFDNRFKENVLEAVNFVLDYTDGAQGGTLALYLSPEELVRFPETDMPLAFSLELGDEIIDDWRGAEDIAKMKTKNDLENEIQNIVMSLVPMFNPSGTTEDFDEEPVRELIQVGMAIMIQEIDNERDEMPAMGQTLWENREASGALLTSSYKAEALGGNLMKNPGFTAFLEEAEVSEDYSFLLYVDGELLKDAAAPMLEEVSRNLEGLSGDMQKEVDFLIKQADRLSYIALLAEGEGDKDLYEYQWSFIIRAEEGESFAQIADRLNTAIEEEIAEMKEEIKREITQEMGAMAMFVPGTSGMMSAYTEMLDSLELHVEGSETGLVITATMEITGKQMDELEKSLQ